MAGLIVHGSENVDETSFDEVGFLGEIVIEFIKFKFSIIFFNIVDLVVGFQNFLKVLEQRQGQRIRGLVAVVFGKLLDDGYHATESEVLAQLELLIY